MRQSPDQACNKPGASANGEKPCKRYRTGCQGTSCGHTVGFSERSIICLSTAILAFSEQSASKLTDHTKEILWWPWQYSLPRKHAGRKEDVTSLTTAAIETLRLRKCYRRALARRSASLRRLQMTVRPLQSESGQRVILFRSNFAC